MVILPFCQIIYYILLYYKYIKEWEETLDRWDIREYKALLLEFDHNISLVSQLASFNCYLEFTFMKG